MPTIAQTTLDLDVSTAVADSYTHAENSNASELVPDTEFRILAALESWHNDTHAGPFAFCYEQPCHAAQQATQVALVRAVPVATKG